MKRVALSLFALLVLASGCSLGPREAWAETMRDALGRAERVGGAHVKQTVEVHVIETNIRLRPQPVIAHSSGVADFERARARLVGSRPRKTQVVYDDLVVYATRSKESAAEDGKLWARFDYEREPSVDIDNNDRRMAVGAGLISPVIALEMLDGVLTGSVREHGTGMKAGAETTRYTARLAPDAAVTEIRDEDRKEGVTRMFATLGVQQDDFPVDVWIDDQDRVRGLRFVMRQQKDRVNAFEMVVSWEFSDFAAVPRIPTPPKSEVVRSNRFRDFVTELIREFG
jgi:hypothetical protein